MTPLEQELRSAIETSTRLHLEENAIFLAERLFNEFPSQSSLLCVAESYRTSGDLNTALRLLRHYSPFNQLIPETSSSSSGNINRNTAGGEITSGSFKWKLFYLHGIVAAKLHLYSECEKVLTQIASSAPPPPPPLPNDGDQNRLNLLLEERQAQFRKFKEEESAVKYWLGIAACHLGETTSGGVKPATLFGQSVTFCPSFFCSFKEAVERCDAMQENNHSYSPSVVTFLMNQDKNYDTQIQQTFMMNQQQQQHNQQQQQQPVESKRAESRQILSSFLHPFAEIVRLLKGSYDCNGALNLIEFTATSSSTQPLQPDAAAASSSSSLVSTNNQATAHLSSQQRFSGWALEQNALAYFHSGRTQDAVRTFQQLREREPWRLNTPSMIYFSTCLWHARNEVALCALAQKMIENIPRSPYTLCVVGNCHSLNRDSRVAATMFSRATSIEPNLAYAHTLRGHELLALEDVTDAETAFYEALKWDHRHYAAFAGLGELYFRTDREGPARENFRSALKINGILPAVLCRLAATYHRIGASRDDLVTALTFYEASLQRCPSHLPSQQQKAAILVRLNRLNDAKELLSKLLATSPGEPSLHVAYGKCLAKLGNQDGAIKSFHRAMDLDPRRQASIKVLLDRVAAKKDVDG